MGKGKNSENIVKRELYENPTENDESDKAHKYDFTIHILAKGREKKEDHHPLSSHQKLLEQTYKEMRRVSQCHNNKAQAQEACTKEKQLEKRKDEQRKQCHSPELAAKVSPNQRNPKGQQHKLRRNCNKR